MSLDLASAPSELLRWISRAGQGVRVATFAGFDAEARFLVRMTAAEAAVPAASTVALTTDDAGAQVVIALQDADARRPIILGRLFDRAAAVKTPIATTVTTDGDKLVFRAEREIELRCGDASIVLTRAGKVLIKGAYVSTRSSGANRIKGAYVDIN